MTINQPCIITSRLLPGVRVAGAEISIAYDGCIGEGRTHYRYYIDLPDDDEYEAADLSSGIQGGNLQQGLSSLLSFLSACGDAIDYESRTGRESENADLFPRYIAEFAAENADELGMIQLELEENDSVIVE